MVVWDKLRVQETCDLRGMFIITGSPHISDYNLCLACCGQQFISLEH